MNRRSHKRSRSEGRDRWHLAEDSVKEDPIWRRFDLFVGDRLGMTVALVLAAVVAGFCESAVIAVVAEIATALVNHQTVVSLSLGPIHLHTRVSELVIIGLGAALLRLALQALLSYLPSRITADAQARFRDRLFAAFTRATWAVRSRDGEGTFQELVTGQVLQAAQGVSQATSLITTSIMVVILMTSALIVGPIPALVVMGAGTALFIAMRPLNAFGARQARALSNAQVDYASGVHDAVSLTEEAQVFGVSKAQEDQLGLLVEDVRHRFFATQFVAQTVSGSYQVLVMILILAGLGLLYLAGSTHIASLGAVVLLLVRASTYGQGAQSAYHFMHQSLPFLNRIAEVEQKYRADPVRRGERELASVTQIAFEEVSYAYIPGVPVLRDVCFRVQPPETIGVVGPSGAGKSTLVQILLGIREPDAGRYRVDGQPANSYSLDTWTRGFAYLPQESRVLHATVADNIRFFRQLDQASVERAARLAHIHDDIMTWPKGYQTVIGQRADAVSGGQRQRICLARALAGQPSVLVLDEPTSALDPRSESLVQDSLEALKDRLTVFIIAHRFSTLRHCDRIIVLRSGYLDAFDSPRELVQSNDFYRRALSLSHLNSLEASFAAAESPTTNGESDE